MIKTATPTMTGISPDAYEALIVQPVQREAVAFQVGTDMPTSATRTHIPVVKADPAAAWTAEGDEIAESAPDVDDEPVIPAKVAGLVSITNELANDSSNPAAASLVGDGLARDIAKRVDQAFFGNLAVPAPPGLESVTGVNAVDAGTAWADLDAFAEAISDAETVGATLTSWVANPTDALALATLKDETGSNRPLLGTDPTQPTRRTVLGLPLFVSPAVTAGTVWGIPRDRVIVVRRQDVDLQVDRSAFFTSDRVAVRAVMRVAFAYPHPAAVQKITLSAA